jgi:2-phosphosulfolactate phosphatase
MFVEINLEFRARDVNRAVERGDLIIVIDVLRSSTSIINALANGVKSIIPTKTLKEAYGIHGQHPDYLLAGERRGHKPKGFDFGNSPLEFSSEQIYGKNMILTTTSGTLALTRSRKAEWVLIGAFLNAGSVAKKAVDVAEKKKVNVSFVLAGEKGQFSLEDFVCAGAIAERFSGRNVYFSDKTLAALFAFRQMKDDLFERIMKAEHAKHLMKLGFRRDVEFSCQLDILRIVPIYKDGKITILQ